MTIWIGTQCTKTTPKGTTRNIQGVTTTQDTRTKSTTPRIKRLLAFALAVIVTFMVGEVIVGFLTHSLTLLADAATC